MKTKRLILLSVVGLLILLVSGCAGTLPTNSYTPQNIVRLTGETSIDDFRYLPFEQGVVQKENQIQNSAIGSIYTSTSISDFVRRGTALELEKTGIVLNEDSKISLNGEVLELKADDLGYSVHWTYSIRYIIKDKMNKNELFSKVFIPEMRKTGKFGLPSDYANVLAEIVLSGYEMFIKEPEVRKLLVVE